MKRPTTVHLKRAMVLLELASTKADFVRLRWQSADLGTWHSARPTWRWYHGRFRFRFSGPNGRQDYWISSAISKAWGIRLLLRNSNNPLPGTLDVVWDPCLPELHGDLGELWRKIHFWLRTKFAGLQVIAVSSKSDPARAISGLFVRVHFRYHGKNHLLVACHENREDEANRILGQALLWLSRLKATGKLKGIPEIHLLVPSTGSAIVYNRCRYLDKRRLRVNIWEYVNNEAKLDIKEAEAPPAARENQDFCWPVMGPFRWSSQLEKVLDLAPDLIRRYPRFQDYDSLRLRGLEFAQAIGPERDRIFFGIGSQREQLTEDNFKKLQFLVEEILFYRRADGPDPRHPFYTLQTERWLESLILEEIPRLFPEITPETVYSQIPVYVGTHAGRIDILGADRQGSLVVMELKTSPDPDLPMQALDYWGRVIQHNENGDFVRRGYFSEIRLNRQWPKLYLVSPVFSFHDTTESLVQYMDGAVEVWKISINEDWRCGVRVLRRIRYLSRNLKKG